MGFSMFSSSATPIAIDFGSSSVKMLQITGGERPNLQAATEILIPDGMRLDHERLVAFYAAKIPAALADLGFKGRKATIAIPSSQTLIQHMQIPSVPGASREDLIKGQLQSQMGCVPGNVVVRSVDVADVHRGGQAQSEVICFAIARDTVMRYVAMLKKCKLNVVGVHTEALATVKAFDHLNRRDGDAEVTTLYLDLGWGGTRVAIAHGRKIVFSRSIQIGGRHFDQQIAESLHCDMATARGHRLSIEDAFVAAATRTDAKPKAPRSALLEAAASAHAANRDDPPAAPTATQDDRRGGHVPAATCHELPSGNPPYSAANVDLTELLDTVTDELSMCLRYHQGLFPHRSIDRSIFVGGESRQVWLCQHVVKALRGPAQLGDPITRVSRPGGPETPGVNFDLPQPGWAVAYGLCNAPTDL